jgi:hypothetical protein
VANGGVRFTVTDPGALARAADPAMGGIAERLRAAAVAGTPRDTGRLAEGYSVQRGRREGVRLLTNAVPYLRFVEYGTRFMPARPALGRALARARNS